MVKILVGLFAAALAVISGIYQTSNMRIAADVAAPDSVFAFAARSDGKITRSRFLERLPLPFEQRYLATAAVVRLESHRDISEIMVADTLLARAPRTADTNALRARIARLRGDHEAAFAIALQARQMDIVNEEIATVAINDLPTAIRLQNLVVTSLEGVRTQREALADAYWHLGALENAAAEHGPVRLHRGRARDAFEANVKLTPLSGRALLSAGYARLLLGERLQAQNHFIDALSADPSSASAYVGLARIAMLHHDMRSAREYSRNAERLAPLQSDVSRLRDDL